MRCCERIFTCQQRSVTPFPSSKAYCWSLILLSLSPFQKVPNADSIANSHPITCIIIVIGVSKGPSFPRVSSLDYSTRQATIIDSDDGNSPSSLLACVNPLWWNSCWMRRRRKVSQTKGEGVLVRPENR